MYSQLKKIGRWFQSSGRFFWPVSLPVQRLPPGLGPRGEREAAKFLQRLGYRILERGHWQRLGEVDLIALDGQCIVFVEVKTWSSALQGDPADAVDRRKQEKLTRAALIYLKRRRLLEQPARFDVISIVWPAHVAAKPDIRHFKNAFEAIGKREMFR